MKLAKLHEDGHWVVVPNHPGGLGGSGKTKKKYRFSSLVNSKDRKRWLKNMQGRK